MDDLKEQFALLKGMVERANKLGDSPKNIQGKE